MANSTRLLAATHLLAFDHVEQPFAQLDFLLLGLVLLMRSVNAWRRAGLGHGHFFRRRSAGHL